MHDHVEGFVMPPDEHVFLAAETFRMLADPTRVKILWALLQGESSVACLADLAATTPTAVSQHLAKLRLAGLVRGRREGTFVYYSAADSHVRPLLTQALSHADHSDSVTSETPVASEIPGTSDSHEVSATPEPLRPRRVRSS